MSTRTTQRSRVIAGLLLLLTGCGSSADKSHETTHGDGAAGQVAAGSGGSAGSAGSSGPAAGSGGQAGSSAQAGSGGQAGSDEHDAGGGEHDAGSGDQAGGAEEDAGSGDQAGSDEDAGSGSMSGDVGPSWANDVHPALVGSCSGCHALNGGGGPPRPGGPGEGGGDAPGKFAVDDAHAAFMATATLVFPGDPSKSSLYIKISEDMPSNGGQRMPPALRQWDDASIQLVHDWIAAGAKEN